LLPYNTVDFHLLVPKVRQVTIVYEFVPQTFGLSMNSSGMLAMLILLFAGIAIIVQNSE
jgi:hypothetical protein